MQLMLEQFFNKFLSRYELINHQFTTLVILTYASSTPTTCIPSSFACLSDATTWWSPSHRPPSQYIPTSHLHCHTLLKTLAAGHYQHHGRVFYCARFKPGLARHVPSLSFLLPGQKILRSFSLLQSGGGRWFCQSRAYVYILICVYM